MTDITLSRPLRTHGQAYRTGASRAEQTDRRPWRSWELRRPWQLVFVALALVHSATTAGALLPPHKKSMGQSRGIRSPPGLSSGTEALTGLGSEAEVLIGHDGSNTALLGLEVESEALTGWTQEPLPDPQLVKHAPDESPWTRPTRLDQLIKTVPEDDARH